MSDHEEQAPAGGPYREAETKGDEDVDTRGVLGWFATNRVAANILMAILMIGGAVALFTQVKQEVFPEVEIEMVLINIPYPGASPAEVEQGVVLAVEEAVRGLDGVKEVRSTAAEGVAVVAVELLLGADKDRALNDVKSAVDRISSLPEDAERPVIALATNRRDVIGLALYGDIPDAERVLHDLADEVRFDLLAKDEITYVEIDGTRPLEISVEVSQAQLRAHNLSLGGVAQQIRASSVEIPGGGVKTRSGEVLLRTTERRDRGEELRDIVLRSRADGSALRLGDVATIEDGFQEQDYEYHFNGQHAVQVEVYRVGDQGPIEVAQAVHDYIANELPARLPPGVSATAVNDKSEVYADRIDLLSRNAKVGLILVLLVLGLFLEPRLAFWVTLGIPISFAGSILFLPGMEVSINMISLFAFIVTLGMVVDDAIVVGEAIYQKRTEGMSRLRAAVEGVREVAIPVCFSIATTCVAFAPMLFVPGVSGKFFRNIPLVVIAVLLISLVESLLILPAHLSHKMPWWMRFLLFPILFPMELLAKLRTERGLGIFIRKAYKPALELALSWRYATFAICLALALGTCALPASGRMQFTFLPKIEGDVITANLRMPFGTSVEETLRYEQRMVETARGVLEAHGGDGILRGLTSEVGRTRGDGGGPMAGQSTTGSHLANVRVHLVQSDQRDVATADFAEQWREAIGEIPGAETLAFSYSIGASGGSPIDIQLTHPDPQVLEDAAERLAEEMRGYPGLRDIDSGVSVGKEQLDLTLTAEGRARGLDETGLARQVRGAFFGAEAVRQQRGREELRVYVRRPESERTSMADVENLIVRTPDGGEMPLSQAANIRRGRAYTSISRTDGRRVIAVTSDIVTGVGNATQIMQSLRENELQALLADVPGLAFEVGGEQKEQARSMSSLLYGQIFAFIVMFGLLAVVFKSYVQPLIIMLGAIPFGVVGALWGHVIMEFGLSMISMMGIVALSGVVVNDSLILIDSINRNRREGKPLWDAVVEGGMRRFRPILLTSLTTFFGLVPMIVEPSVQARFLIPMAISLGFGVLFATVILLLLVPACYLIIEDLKGLGGWLSTRLAPSPSEPEPDQDVYPAAAE